MNTLFKTVVWSMLLAMPLLMHAEPNAGMKKLSKDDEAKLQVIETAYTVSELREYAIANSKTAVKAFFNSRAALRWQRIANDYSEEQINDFFLGATILSDGKSTEYSALYNPWWDTLLLLKSSGLPKIPKVDAFCFVSGVKFRNEKDVPVTSLEGTVPKARPFAVDLWDVCRRTVRQYKDVFAKNPAADFTRCQVADAADTERIQVRSAVRLKLWLMFLQNSPMQREARRISKYLTAGHEDKLKSYFVCEGADFIRYFAEIPAELRRDFIPYCYFHGPEGTMFLLFNKNLPRIIVTVTMPRKGLKRILEWYDLQASEKIMAAWNSVQEVK